MDKSNKEGDKEKSVVSIQTEVSSTSVHEIYNNYIHFDSEREPSIRRWSLGIK